jgi:hypothetical protein
VPARSNLRSIKAVTNSSAAAPRLKRIIEDASLCASQAHEVLQGKNVEPVTNRGPPSCEFIAEFPCGAPELSLVVGVYLRMHNALQDVRVER